MKTPPALNRLLVLSALALSVAVVPCMAQSIYKCPGAHGVVYTDHPCIGHKGTLLHQADDSDVIDHYLDLGQDASARRYADARQLDALYASRLQAYRQRKKAEQQRQAEAAQAAAQYEQEARQQALARQQATQARLQAENDALRQQNDAYQDELDNAPNGYASSGYLIDASSHHRHRLPHDDGHDHGNGHDHPRALPPQPAYHPCTQLAGERTVC